MAKPRKKKPTLVINASIWLRDEGRFTLVENLDHTPRPGEELIIDGLPGFPHYLSLSRDENRILTSVIDFGGVGCDPNCFNINGHGVVPVAINGSAEFDVYDIDVGTLLFGGLQVRIRGNKGPLCSIEDWNDDGHLDMVCYFEDDPGNWTEGDSTATQTGSLLDGTAIEGTDSICIVP